MSEIAPESEPGVGYYAASVPKEIKANIEYRKKIRELCRTNKAARKRVMECCRVDPLFFFNVFCWLYEPRPKVIDGVQQPNQFPMITWPHQEPAVKEIYENLGYRDIGLEKSRGEGASWIIVLLAMHAWLFKDMQAIGLVSKDENSVDNPDDPDSLFWKMTWELTKLPRWMAGKLDVDYKRDRGKHVLKNLRNGSSITGYAATSNVGTGGRKTWFGMDELGKFPRPQDSEAMASTQHVTNSRLVASTPWGASGAYYEAMHRPSNMVKLRLHWKDNPTKNRGLYRFVDGRPVAVDPENNPLPQEYLDCSPRLLELFERLRRSGFKLEGMDRSPWYDNECDRIGATPQNIAQELDIDYGGSAFRIFGHDCMEKAHESARAELLRGDIDFTDEDLEPVFDEIDNGPFRIWMPLDSQRRPPPRPFYVGCDIASGLGGSFTSNSTMIAIDGVTGEQVLEFASNTIAPADFADLAIATCKWLNDAYLSWEVQGPGGGFTRQVIVRKYPNTYYRTVLSRRRQKKTKELGWSTTQASKEVMFEELRASIRNGTCVVRSTELVAELGQYIRKEQKIFNALSANAPDDSIGVSHGDRVIGFGVALMALRDRPVTAKTEEEQARNRRPPPGTLAEREAEVRNASRRSVNGWNARNIRDYARGR